MFFALTVAVGLATAAKPTAAFTPKARPYDAQSYRIDVTLKDEGRFENTLTAVLKPKRALPEIELDAYNLEVSSVTVDGAVATFKLKANPAEGTGLILIKPTRAPGPGKDAVVEVKYAVTAGNDALGIFQVEAAGPDGAPGYFTHFETQGAQRFFPCNDQPDDKATTEIFAVVDGRYTVLSNGRKEKDETFSGDGKNLRRVHWVQDQPHSTYLVALAIGAFEPVLVGGDTPATVWVQPGSTDRAFVAQDATRSLLNFEAAFVGTRYPWAKLDQVAVPRFLWGGMENTSLIFNRESAMVLPHKNEIANRPHVVGLIAHELAHQWFGDLVTCKWWDDMWLNEGFASYLGSLATDAYLDNDMVEVSRANELLVDYFRAEDGPRAHPLVGKNGASPDEVFDSVSYTKGEQVLRMLELWVGKADMKAALKSYLEKHKNGVATSDDFFAAVYASSKKGGELKAFKDSWLHKRGYPVITPETSYRDGTLTVTIKQQPNHSTEKGPFVFKLPIVVHRDNEPKYTKEAVLTVNGPTLTAKIDVPAAPQWINWNKDLGALVKVSTSAVGETQWLDAARFDPDPSWRLQAVWALMGEMVNPAAKEETKPTELAMGAIVDVLTKDPSPYVREEAMERLIRSRWKKLPVELGAPVLSQAKRPSDLNEDAVGLVRVRRSAMALLGKIDLADGRRYLLEEVAKKEPDINYLPGLTRGVALIGSNESLAQLRAATNRQKARGYPYYRICAEALATAENAEAAAMIGDELKANAANHELVRGLISGLRDNETVRSQADFPQRVREWVLDDATFSVETRARLLRLIDELKTKEAKEALTTITEKSSSDRIKGAAKQVLEANFKAK